MVFFDLDGTLHKENMFSAFMRYLLFYKPFNLFLIIPLLPAISIGFLLLGRTARWPLSLLLWSMTFGNSKKSLLKIKTKFVVWFRQRITKFPIIHNHLNNYIKMTDVDVWLITGSPKFLVESVYCDSTFLSHIKLISTEIDHKMGGYVITMRCLGKQKVIQLEKIVGKPLKIYSGYSDSKLDDALLIFCQNSWRVTKTGELKKIK